MTETGQLTAAQRQLVVGVCVISGAFTMVAAAYNYLIDPMLEDLGARDSQSSLLRQLPSIAALVVVFLAGVVSDRFGDRRILLWSGALFSTGSLVIAVAPGFQVAAIGLVVQSIAVSAGSVVSLGLLSARISDQKARASAFSAFAIIAPIIYLLVPVVSGVMVDQRTWRLVPGLWAIGGLAAIWAARRLLPEDGPPRRSGEMITPLLAGAVLASGVQAVNAATRTGWTSPDALIRIGLAVLALTALFVLFRRLESPSLSLAALRAGGMLILLVVVLLIPFANLWYYATMAYQYVFNLNTLQTALAMAPAQLAAVVGAAITRKVLQRRGVSATGTLLLALFAASMLLFLLLAADSALWVLIGVVAAYAAAYTGVSIPVTNAIMNSAPAGEEGSASAFRTASGHVGNALGVVFSTTVVLTGVTASLTSTVTSQGLVTDNTRDVVNGILDGATSESLSAQYSMPVADVETLGEDVLLALVEGLHRVALAGSVVALICAGIFAFAVHRQQSAA